MWGMFEVSSFISPSEKAALEYKIIYLLKYGNFKPDVIANSFGYENLDLFNDDLTELEVDLHSLIEKVSKNKSFEKEGFGVIDLNFGESTSLLWAIKNMENVKSDFSYNILLVDSGSSRTINCPDEILAQKLIETNHEEGISIDGGEVKTIVTHINSPKTISDTDCSYKYFIKVLRDGDYYFKGYFTLNLNA